MGNRAAGNCGGLSAHHAKARAVSRGGVVGYRSARHFKLDASRVVNAASNSRGVALSFFSNHGAVANRKVRGGRVVNRAAAVGGVPAKCSGQRYRL